MVLSHPPFQPLPCLPGAKVSSSFFRFHIILRYLCLLMVADLPADCGAQSRNALKHHLIFLSDFSLYTAAAQLNKFELLSPFSVTFYILSHVFTLIFHREHP